jgi:hypothetical protein
MPTKHNRETYMVYQCSKIIQIISETQLSNDNWDDDTLKDIENKLGALIGYWNRFKNDCQQLKQNI